MGNKSKLRAKGTEWKKVRNPAAATLPNARHPEQPQIPGDAKKRELAAYERATKFKGAK